MKKIILMNLTLLCVLSAFGQTSQKRPATTSAKKLVTTPAQNPATQQPVKPKRPKMAIEYFAEFDLSDNKVFGESHANDEGKYFKQPGAKRACPDGWHLPTEYELEGIVPRGGRKGDDWNVRPLKFFDNGRNLMNWPENIQIGKDDTAKVYLGDFSYPGNNICYALRFKKDNVSTTDNKMLAAYKYELLGLITDRPDGPQKPGPAFRLKVTVRYLGENFEGTIADIANEDFWQNNKNNDVVRIFSAGGTTWGKPGGGLGNSGYYMSSSVTRSEEYRNLDVVKTTATNDEISAMNFGINGASVGGVSPPDLIMYVRCVSDK